MHHAIISQIEGHIVTGLAGGAETCHKQNQGMHIQHGMKATTDQWMPDAGAALWQESSANLWKTC